MDDRRALPQPRALPPWVEQLFGCTAATVLARGLATLQDIEPGGWALSPTGPAGSLPITHPDTSIELALVHLPETSASADSIGVAAYVAASTAAALSLEAKLGDAQREARHDHLTGLLNRSGWDKALSAADALRSDPHPRVVGVIDLDDLRVVNDACGHDAGDHLLRLTAQTLVAGVRDSDVVARIGGDEFGVLLIGEHEDRLAPIKRLSDGLTAAGVSHAVGSVAAAAAEPLAETARRADAAMYEMKRAKVRSPLGHGEGRC